MPLIRRLGNAVFTQLMRFLTRWPLKDSQPDGSGGWTYWWYWTDDVGAKNEQSNPTHYKIAVSAPGLDYLQAPPDKPTWWQIWVRASIDYVPWDQESF
jgi:hypothetical protein